MAQRLWNIDHFLTIFMLIHLFIFQNNGHVTSVPRTGVMIAEWSPRASVLWNGPSITDQRIHWIQGPLWVIRLEILGIVISIWKAVLESMKNQQSELDWYKMFITKCVMYRLNKFRSVTLEIKPLYYIFILNYWAHC